MMNDFREHHLHAGIELALRTFRNIGICMRMRDDIVERQMKDYAGYKTYDHRKDGIGILLFEP